MKSFSTLVPYSVRLTLRVRLPAGQFPLAIKIGESVMAGTTSNPGLRRPPDLLSLLTCFIILILRRYASLPLRVLTPFELAYVWVAMLYALAWI